MLDNSLPGGGWCMGSCQTFNTSSRSGNFYSDILCHLIFFKKNWLISTFGEPNEGTSQALVSSAVWSWLLKILNVEFHSENSTEDGFELNMSLILWEKVMRLQKSVHPFPYSAGASTCRRKCVARCNTGAPTHKWKPVALCNPGASIYRWKHIAHWTRSG